MKNLINFQYEGQQIRTVVKDGQPWFVAKDVCNILEIGKDRDAVSRLDEDERGSVLLDTLGGKQSVNAVNEPGLYNLIFGSRKPEAKQFKRWVTHEVLPVIRKTGRYELNPQQAAGNDPVINELAKRLTLSEIAAIFEVRSRSEKGGENEKIKILSQGQQTTRRCHSKLDRLNVKEEVQELLQKGCTYQEISNIMKERGVSVSRSSIGRFGKKYLREFSRQEVILPSGLRVIQENRRLF